MSQTSGHSFMYDFTAANQSAERVSFRAPVLLVISFFIGLAEFIVDPGEGLRRALVIYDPLYLMMSITDDQHIDSPCPLLPMRFSLIAVAIIKMDRRRSQLRDTPIGWSSDTGTHQQKLDYTQFFIGAELENPAAPGVADYTSASTPILLQILNGDLEASQLQPNGSAYTLPPNKAIELSIPDGQPEGPHPWSGYHSGSHSSSCIAQHAFSVVRNGGSDAYNYVNSVQRDTTNKGASTTTPLELIVPSHYSFTATFDFPLE
ncbi:hypothetical protein DFH29DRAFT_873622 [Suillus ampliporus]|nr:hypothetical protein DFH29DRAFT_873622 [Suillus ampliporus]